MGRVAASGRLCCCVVIGILNCSALRRIEGKGCMVSKGFPCLWELNKLSDTSFLI